MQYIGEVILFRLQELRVDLNETKQSRSQLEQVTYALSEELRALRNKVEGQQAEFVNMVTDVRNRARKLEEENRIHVRFHYYFIPDEITCFWIQI